jgi:L-alanine-DL-glutamate epimerase-like enolase superfamily enzyme
MKFPMANTLILEQTVHHRHIGRTNECFPVMPLKNTDVRVTGCRLYFLPVQTRVPLKFGPETLTSVTCVRVALDVEDMQGYRAVGWGETPLSVQWVWPSRSSYESRHVELKNFCLSLGAAWAEFDAQGHAMEVGADFQSARLLELWQSQNHQGELREDSMPWLAALVCNSAFDLALHDAYGLLAGCPTYRTYHAHFMSRDLADYLEPATNSMISFRGQFPQDYLREQPAVRLRAWHLVGGLDILHRKDLTGSEPNDGYPVVLEDWIRHDGLKCLKIKLRGTDAAWDLARLTAVGEMALATQVDWLSADFNCTVTDPEYVNEILDRLRDDYPRIYGMILYVEQPFPYELEQHPLLVHGVSSRKPLFLDESAHDWRLVRLGRELGWNGVALKTCKTQTGAILSACWAQAHGMALMVQDLTNPMLAQIPHLQLAAHLPTIMGVETNAMQFYPEASACEAHRHPGLYERRQGMVDLTTLQGPGFGYCIHEINRTLPEPAGVWT